MAEIVATGFNPGVKMERKCPRFGRHQANSPHPLPPKRINVWAAVFSSERRQYLENEKTRTRQNLVLAGRYDTTTIPAAKTQSRLFYLT